MRIQELIAKLQEEGNNTNQIANKLKVSQSMVSQYKKGYNASLAVAIEAYKLGYGTLFPFSTEALKELAE